MLNGLKGRTPRLFHAAVLLLVGLLPLTAGAAAQKATVVLVRDGEGASRSEMAARLESEITQVLGSDFQVDFLLGPEFTGDYTLAGVSRVLERAQARSGVDLVVCAGPIGSTAALLQENLPRPTIATLLYGGNVQDLPTSGRGSGVANLNYVTPSVSLEDQLGALLSLVPDLSRLAILGSDGFFEAMARVQVEGPVWEENGIRLTGVRAGRTAASAMAALPADSDAVMLPQLIGFSEEEIDALLEALEQRQVPTLALEGEGMVRRGALVGILPADWTERLVRRVALNARKILGGQPAAELPVALSTDGETFINISTARAMNISPPFSVLVDAVSVDPVRTEGRRLTLAGVMDEAMAGNKDVAVAAQAVEVARREVDLTRARLLPSIDADLTGVMLDEDRALAARRPAERSWTLGVGATQVLWSDEIWAGLDVQREALAAREAEYQQVRLDVALAAADAYFQVLRALTAEDIQRTNLASSRQNLERARMRVRLGIANRSELLRWESKIATEKASMIDAVVQRNLAEMALNRLLGRPQEENIVLAEPQLDDELSLLAHETVSELMTNAWDLRQLRRYLVQFALSSSPELAQLDAGIAAQRRLLTSKKRDFFMPDVALSFGWSRYLDESGAGAGADDRAVWPLDDSEWSAALSFSLPLFEGGGRFSDKAQAGHELLRLMNQRDATAERIEQRMRTAVHVTSGRFAAIDLWRQAAEASRENLKLVNDAYGQGAVDLITQLDAQTAALQAELAAADAAYAFLQSLMEAERAAGGFTIYATEEGKQAWLQDLSAWIQTQER